MTHLLDHLLDGPYFQLVKYICKILTHPRKSQYRDSQFEKSEQKKIKIAEITRISKKSRETICGFIYAQKGFCH